MASTESMRLGTNVVAYANGRAMGLRGSWIEVQILSSLLMSRGTAGVVSGLSIRSGGIETHTGYYENG